jgi:hypothetical protein
MSPPLASSMYSLYPLTTSPLLDVGVAQVRVNESLVVEEAKELGAEGTFAIMTFRA